MRTCTLLDQTGDTTICWDEDADEKMEAVIAKKMKEGVSFWIVEPRLGGLIPPKRTKLKKPADAKKHRAVSVADSDFLALIDSGDATATATPPGEIKTKRRAKTPKEAASNSTVATRPLVGG